MSVAFEFFRNYQKKYFILGKKRVQNEKKDTKIHTFKKNNKL